VYALCIVSECTLFDSYSFYFEFSQTKYNDWHDEDFKRLKQQFSEQGIAALRDFADPPVEQIEHAVQYSPRTPSSQTQKYLHRATSIQ
jgi:hypothetical protein